MRILVADTFPEDSLTELSELGHECHYRPDLGSEQLREALLGTEILVVRSTPVTAAVLENADALRMVIRAGSGTNTIDRTTASGIGVHVCNVPGRNAVAVAELAFGLLLALDRGIPDGVADLRAGHWNKQRYSRARGIHGRRVGVLGLGRIGLRFAERAVAFGTHVHAVENPERDPRTKDRAAELGIEFVSDPHELARTCDVLSLHLPLTETTRHIVDRELLAQARPGTILLNTSRSELIDESALIEAMDTKGMRAGIDVFPEEPESGRGTIESRLATHPNVYGTHHIGASTEQAQRAVADEVVRMVESFDAGTVLHCVNEDSLSVDRTGSVAVSAHSGGVS
ncbi:hydroxyacid dehydrogenase [Actinopolyspora erythraea]|uniref:Hydroxyacid dehydrogenase n=1 Tax=Actinopolyspora erythraea TaxID=414996 RepID=A0A099D657_9ACTN|nr:NAD(P)-dependent oxidoreductase [Actinopolyspora erythraea]ASU78801.1 hydroxyacid dehydrogenase [Actinopolyspora erythraea]KGI81317.1 2-hydroxyacid dehydrogenase [Actinopolyspora erythraea]